jgi:hypothetical protein
MRRACLSLGDIHCDQCQRLIEHSEQYLIITEEDGERKQLCADCSLEQGFAHYKEDKRERVLTFFPE